MGKEFSLLLFIQETLHLQKSTVATEIQGNVPLFQVGPWW